MERKFPYLKYRVTDGEVRKLPIRKKNPGDLLGPLAGASITVTREDRYEGVISAAIRTVHGGLGRPGPSRSGDPGSRAYHLRRRPVPRAADLRVCACRGGGGGGGVQRAGRARADGDRPGRPWCSVSPQAREARRPYRRGAVRAVRAVRGAAGVRLRPGVRGDGPAGEVAAAGGPHRADGQRDRGGRGEHRHRGSGAVPREPAACGRGRRGGSCQTSPGFPVRRAITPIPVQLRRADHCSTDIRPAN